jgi:hypothetical protein
VLVPADQTHLQRHASEERVELARAEVRPHVEHETVRPWLVFLAELGHAAVLARGALRGERLFLIERDLDADGGDSIGRVEHVCG